MRYLVIVKDSDGKVKLAQFGNDLQCEWQEEPLKSNAQLLYEYSSYFLSFVKDSTKRKKLEENIRYLSFYTSSDMPEFYKKSKSEKKADKDYIDKWFDDRTSIFILDTIIEKKPENVKLFDYSKYTTDTMFADTVFEVDFQHQIATVFVKNNPVERFDFRSKTLDSVEKKTVKEVKKDANRIDEVKTTTSTKGTGQNSRVGLW